MVQTRAAAKSEVPLPQAILVDYPSGYVAPSPPKNRRGNVKPPKKHRRGKRGELCQLNLDVLFLVRRFSYLVLTIW